MPPVVAGIDSSTQSVKVVLRDADSGEYVASAVRPHPDGSEVDPRHWIKALLSALEELKDFRIDAISIFAQQHGLIALDHVGNVIRDALLWNDTRSASAAKELNREFPDIHQRTGSQLVASFTASKLRWLAENEPANINRLAAIALPHDWLSWQLNSRRELGTLFTDRSDASGTGYFDSVSNLYQREILSVALKSERSVVLPKVLGPNELGGETEAGTLLAAGGGDNAGAALALDIGVGDLLLSIGTSGTAFSVSSTPSHDVSGEVAGFADATGRFLPLACTLNAAKVFATVSQLLGATLEEFDSLALSAEPGANGLRLIPHLDGERTPNRPKSRGFFFGITHSNLTRENMARAAVEGVVAGMLYAARAVERSGIPSSSIYLIGGGSNSQAVQQISANLFGTPIQLPSKSEYVADGAARQAAWALHGVDKPPAWPISMDKVVEPRHDSREIADHYLQLLESHQSET